jgi:hypothetical protein
MDSDHSLILLTLSENTVRKENNPALVNKQIDWESFKQCLEERINMSVPVQNEEQLDDEVNTFIKHIQQAAWENTPELKEGKQEITIQKKLWT